MAMNALPQKVSYTSGETKREAGLHSGGEIPVALIDKYIYLVLGESFADVHEADGVVSGALQYAEDVVLDVWSFNEYHDGTEKVPLDDTLFSSFDPEKFIEGVIVTSEAFWKQYQEKRGFLLGNIFETMYQVPVIVPEADAVYFGDENIYELLPKGELKDTIYHAFRYALDEKEFI